MIDFNLILVCFTALVTDDVVAFVDSGGGFLIFVVFVCVFVCFCLFVFAFAFGFFLFVLSLTQLS